MQRHPSGRDGLGPLTAMPLPPDFWSFNSHVEHSVANATGVVVSRPAPEVHRTWGPLDLPRDTVGYWEKYGWHAVLARHEDRRWTVYPPNNDPSTAHHVPQPVHLRNVAPPPIPARDRNGGEWLSVPNWPRSALLASMSGPRAAPSPLRPL